MDNELKRRKRRARARYNSAEIDEDDDDDAPTTTTRRPRGVKFYEQYESQRTKSRRPNIDNVAKETETTKTKSRNEQQKCREKLPYTSIHRKPKSQGSDTSDDDDSTSEIDDLNDDDYFYEQLEKRKPTTESNEDVEQVSEKQPHVNRDVVFVHGLNHHKRRGKHRQKYTKINSDAAILADINDDTYDDYGEIDTPDLDVEMHETYEPMTKEGHMQQAVTNKYNYGPVRPAYEQRPRTRWRIKNPVMLNARPNGSMFTRRVPPMNLRQVPPMNARPNMNTRLASNMSPRPNGGMLAYSMPPKKPSKIVPIDRPVHKQTFERITITKKLNSPDELHEEIDKIFEMKNENYHKKGHDKSHWELRIVLLRYKTHEEYDHK